MTFEQALSYPLVKRWAASASLDRDSLGTMWGADEAGEGPPEGITKQAEGFKVRDGRGTRGPRFRFLFALLR